MKLLKTYGFSLLLLGSIAGGVLLGSLSPEAAQAIRPWAISSSTSSS